jgi:hypothetical protein
VLGEFRECIDFASSCQSSPFAELVAVFLPMFQIVLVSSSKQPAPPLPPLNGLPPSPAATIPTERERPPRELPRLPGYTNDGTIIPPGHQSPSPMNGLSLNPQDESSNPPPRPRENGYSHPDPRTSEKMPNSSIPPDAPPQLGPPPRPSTGQPFPSGPPPSFGVGQIVPSPQSPNVGQQPGPELPLRGGANPNFVHPPHMGQPHIGQLPTSYHHQNANTMNQLHPPRPPEGFGSLPPQPSSDPAYRGGVRKSPSAHSVMSGDPPANKNYSSRPYDSLHAPQPRTLLPSVNSRAISMVDPANAFLTNPSPPTSPVQETVPTGPVTSTISAQMKCKVFLQQQHAQWKSLGSAKLKLYRQSPTNVKQLVVEAENKERSVLISTIVLTDGVERVGKTGVAIELSDKGQRTGIVYMIQLRNENSAGGLFDSLLAGSDRAGRG